MVKNTFLYSTRQTFLVTKKATTPEMINLNNGFFPPKKWMIFSFWNIHNPPDSKDTLGGSTRASSRQK